MEFLYVSSAVTSSSRPSKYSAGQYTLVSWHIVDLLSSFIHWLTMQYNIICETKVSTNNSAGLEDKSSLRRHREEPIAVSIPEMLFYTLSFCDDGWSIKYNTIGIRFG